MRLCYQCVITFARVHTNDVYNRSIRSNHVQNLFFIISKKNVQTLKLTGSLAQGGLRTPQAKSMQFCCWTGICKNKLLTS